MSEESDKTDRRAAELIRRYVAGEYLTRSDIVEARRLIRERGAAH